MALTRPAKDTGNAHRKPAFETTFLARRDGTMVGPELPDCQEWNQQARDWYDMWRRSEIAAILEPSDWFHLQNVAVLVGLFWSPDVKPSSKVAIHAEIRKCEASYGATYFDRLVRRIKFVESQEPSTPEAAISPVNYEALMEDD
ncbi:hypothetical protein [Micromonospora globbae]|uniref:phage terminase small subunit n=1 Tax=Micromonospora globbae TaxID=1894969 RepID=UPI0011C4A45F|nr:hypothetical protein [Micromonospora globbae]